MRGVTCDMLGRAVDGWGGPPQLQALAMIYSIVAAVYIYVPAAARREQCSSFALSYRQRRQVPSGCRPGIGGWWVSSRDGRRVCWKEPRKAGAFATFPLLPNLFLPRGHICTLLPPTFDSRLAAVPIICFCAQDKCRRVLRRARRDQAKGREAGDQATSSQPQGGGAATVDHGRARSRSTREDAPSDP